jgi:HD-GYP domain-containing protein (c-di-GMP phosphodiesterase class II)
MSSDHPSDARSSAARESGGGAAAGTAPDLTSLLRARGAPLIEALERHLPGAREHAEGTAAYAFAASVELGFERTQCEVAREAAKLHEIGQVYVPAGVLAKPASERDAAETGQVDAHYEAGYRLARGAGVPEYACGWLLRARERYDGAGPEGLAADRIPIESRLIRAACACETALSAPPDTAGPLPHRHAILELGSRAGNELDPRVAAALTAVIERAAA